MNYIKEFIKQEGQELKVQPCSKRVAKSYANTYEEFYKNYLENSTPKYVIGFDPYKEDKNGSLGITGSLPIKELKEQLNKVKQENKMKTKKFYHTFDFKDRTITLCVLVKENLFTNPILTVGYAVLMPEDVFDKELAKKISLGRAESDKTQIVRTNLNEEFAFNNGVLKAVSRIYENKIKKGKVVIKGIR